MRTPATNLLTLILFVFALVTFTPQVEGQGARKRTATTGLINVGPDQKLRVSVANVGCAGGQGEKGVPVITVRIVPYVITYQGAFTRLHGSQPFDREAGLASGEAAYFEFSPANNVAGTVRAVVETSSQCSGLKITTEIIELTSGKTVSLGGQELEFSEVSGLGQESN